MEHDRDTAWSRWARGAPALWLIVAVALAGCDRRPALPAPEPRPIEVEIVQAEPADLPVTFEFVGRTQSSQRVEIRARVSGFIDEIAYEEGEIVERGEVMFRIDPAPFESRLRAAEAELAQQQARLDNAEALLVRIEPLAAADAVADKELDDARGQVREAAAAVEAAAARVFDAELDLGYATISSPTRGLTGSAEQREGAYVTSSTPPLTYVARVDPIWVEFSVTETELLRSRRATAEGTVVQPADGEFDVSLVLADGSLFPETGRLSFFDASISPETGSVLVRAEIPNPDETLRPGQYVRAQLVGAVRPAALTVPKRAVREGARGPFVWIIGADGNAEQRPVRLGPWEGDDWVIEHGLPPGARVVVNGAVRLQPGAPVTVGRILPGRSTAGPADAGRAP